MLTGPAREVLATTVVDAIFKVHVALGPGLLESTYQSCLIHELTRRSIPVTREVILPVTYRDVTIDNGYRVDMIVNDSIIIENKSVQALLPVHQSQLITYLKLTGIQLGFLVNWNVPRIKSGIKRTVLGLQPFA
jgi:GxxExxY protein